ncbi:MAG: cobalamin-binding protein [Firmicutes bacterium HGW-Firmicutes-14]|nr:MAG: cobalamin-binding protein [Firmicutes bacterium HGW-Firmicutes-14]
MKDDLINAIAELDEEKTLQLVREKVKNGETPLEIVEQCRLGVEKVGQRYSEDMYYLSDLVMSEEILRGVMEILEPYFSVPGFKNGVKVVIGTIEDDIHDLGKNIVISLLRSEGFEVYDLGVDVKPEEFVQKINETDTGIVGVSVVLTFSISYVKKLVRLLHETGLRDKVKVIIGGYPVNEMIREYTGADYFQTDAKKAVKLIKRIAGLEK